MKYLAIYSFVKKTCLSLMIKGEQKLFSLSINIKI